MIERIVAASGATAMAAGAGVVTYFEPTNAGFFPVCPLYTLTGFACPGCGLTRGFHALFHGDALGALDYNAMLPFFSALIGFGFVSLVYFALRGRRIPVNLLHPNALWVFFVLLLIFGVVRNLPWYPFSVLFP
ncbi:MAG: DUF2752 domain-containing protein [Acidobacteriota bacterium]